MSYIKEKLDLDKILRYTILKKLVPRIRSSLLNLILSRVLKLLYSHGEDVSITASDVTGFTSSYVSHYFQKLIKKQIMMSNMPEF